MAHTAVFRLRVRPSTSHYLFYSQTSNNKDSQKSYKNIKWFDLDLRVTVRPVTAAEGHGVDRPSEPDVALFSAALHRKAPPRRQGSDVSIATQRLEAQLARRTLCHNEFKGHRLLCLQDGAVIAQHIPAAQRGQKKKKTQDGDRQELQNVVPGEQD